MRARTTSSTGEARNYVNMKVQVGIYGAALLTSKNHIKLRQKLRQIGRPGALLSVYLFCLTSHPAVSSELV
jgi:hypothetical protein